MTIPYKSRYLFILLMGSLLSLGCAAYHQEWQEQKQEVAYIRFTGESKDVSVKIDDNPRFKPDSGPSEYEVEPGVRHIRIFKSGSLKNHRKIYLDAGNTREIKLP